MLCEVRAASAQVEQVVATLDVDVLDPALAADYVAAFAELERLAAAGKALAARRVVATGAWKRQGAHRRAAEWLASLSGTSVGRAAQQLETAEQLAELPATEAALRAGDLSGEQATLIADAATADPHAEHDLLSHAATNGVKGLRRECGRVKAAACPDEVAHHQRIHAQRYLRSFTDHDGAGRIDIRGPLDATATILAALKPIEAELFALARQAGRTERAEAIAFDALVELARRSRRTPDTTARNGTPAAHVSVRIDHSALVRGHTEPGEICEIDGLGPVPVAIVSQLLDDAFVKVLLADGTDVLAVSHLGRFVSARLRSALEERYPECVIEGCHVTEHLEIDHNLPIEFGGPTALWNLSRLCGHHHRHKHLHDLRLEGTGTTQHFVPATEWTPPERGP